MPDISYQPMPSDTPPTFSLRTIVSTIRSTMGQSIVNALAYSYSFNIMLLMTLAATKNEAGPAAQAASLMNPLVFFAVAHLFSINIQTSTAYGNLKQLLANAQNNDTAIAQGRATIKKIFNSGLLISFMFTPLPMLAMIFSKTILETLGQSEESASSAQDYLRTYAWAFPFLVLHAFFEQALLGFGKRQQAMTAGVTSFIMGAIASILFYRAGYGLTGIAYGAIIETCLVTTWLATYLLYHPELKQFKFFRNNAYDPTQTKTLLKIGLPMTLTMVCETAAVFVLSLFAGWLGKEALNSWGFAAWLIFTTMIFSFATVQTTCQQSLTAVGSYAADPDPTKLQKAQRFVRLGPISAGIFTLILGITESAYPKILTSLDGSGVPPDMKYLLWIITAAAFADACRLNMLQMLRSTNTPLVRAKEKAEGRPVTSTDSNTTPSTISIIGLWLGVGAAYGLGFKTDFGLQGIGLGYMIGISLGAIMMLPRWLKNTSQTHLGQVAQEFRLSAAAR